MDERERTGARGRHARGDGAPAGKAPENRFNSHFRGPSGQAPPLSSRVSFLVPTTSKRLLRRLFLFLKWVIAPLMPLSYFFYLFIYLFIFICSTDICTALIGVGLVVKDEKSGLASLEKGAL